GGRSLRIPGSRRMRLVSSSSKNDSRSGTTPAHFVLTKWNICIGAHLQSNSHPRGPTLHADTPQDGRRRLGVEHRDLIQLPDANIYAVTGRIGLDPLRLAAYLNALRPALLPQVHHRDGAFAETSHPSARGTFRAQRHHIHGTSANHDLR